MSILVCSLRIATLIKTMTVKIPLSLALAAKISGNLVDHLSRSSRIIYKSFFFLKDNKMKIDCLS